MPRPIRLFANAGLALALTFSASQATAHEMWLLTPDEIERLSAAPMPDIFTSRLWLFAASIAALVGAGVALRIEPSLAPIEDRLAAPFRPHVLTTGALVLRLGLAFMLGLASLGGLPRHGTDPWTQPTLLVPDMQLSLVPGWDWLAAAQMVVALCLVVGIFTRIAGLVLIGVSVLGLAVFGSGFLSYAPHFAAPGLLLVLIGGQRLSLDVALGIEPPMAPTILNVGYRAAQVLVGLGFVYLAVAYKLTQPTLLIAILEHGRFDYFGAPLPIVALIMTFVEIVCGALIAMGRLVRPVALILICAITFLAVVLGETPLFHANLYAIMALFALAGGRMSAPVAWHYEARGIAA